MADGEAPTYGKMSSVARNYDALINGADKREDLVGMVVRTADYFRDALTRFLPNTWMMPTNKVGIQDDPDYIYPNSMLPCLDESFMIVFEDDPVDGVLRLTKESLERITLLSTGIGDPGDALNIWWQQSYADTTLQESGVFVYQGHTFWGTAHTFAIEGVWYRGVNEDDPTLDPIRLSRNLMDGAGSYYEQALLIVAMLVGLQAQPNGSQCPVWLGNIGYNGDMAQVTGAGLPTISQPELPFKTWERPLNFGSRDSAFKMNAKLTMGPSVAEIEYTGSNPPAGDLYVKIRIRICGFRECGEYVPGCAVKRRQVVG